jgi:hypothetical protein
MEANTDPDTLLGIEKRLTLTYAINALLSELASWQRKVPDVGGCQAFDQIFLERARISSRRLFIYIFFL